MSEICIFSLHHQPASALLMPILSRPGSVKLPSTGFNCVTTTVLPYQRNHSGRWARQSVRWDNKRVKNMPSEYWLPSCVKHGISYESMTMTDNTARIWAHTFTRCNFCYFAYLISLNKTPLTPLFRLSVLQFHTSAYKRNPFSFLSASTSYEYKLYALRRLETNFHCTKSNNTLFQKN